MHGVGVAGRSDQRGEYRYRPSRPVTPILCITRRIGRARTVPVRFEGAPGHFLAPAQATALALTPRSPSRSDRKGRNALSLIPLSCSDLGPAAATETTQRHRLGEGAGGRRRRDQRRANHSRVRGGGPRRARPSSRASSFRSSPSFLDSRKQIANDGRLDRGDALSLQSSPTSAGRCTAASGLDQGMRSRTEEVEL